jgi:hypothetical protein
MSSERGFGERARVRGAGHIVRTLARGGLANAAALVDTVG